MKSFGKMIHTMTFQMSWSKDLKKRYSMEGILKTGAFIMKIMSKAKKLSLKKHSRKDQHLPHSKE